MGWLSYYSPVRIIERRARRKDAGVADRLKGSGSSVTSPLLRPAEHAAYDRRTVAFLRRLLMGVSCLCLLIGLYVLLGGETTIRADHAYALTYLGLAAGFAIAALGVHIAPAIVMVAAAFAQLATELFFALPNFKEPSFVSVASVCLNVVVWWFARSGMKVRAIRKFARVVVGEGRVRRLRLVRVPLDWHVYIWVGIGLSLTLLLLLALGERS